MPQLNIGFVSTRFAGNDGVSLEARKWAEVLEGDGINTFWFSGRSDHPDEVSMVIPEAYFGHSENEWINSRIWGDTRRDSLVTERIHEVASYIKAQLARFVEKFRIDILIIENAITIPMHVPLGVAITHFLAETAMPAIAHHHDFFWERKRFARNAVPDLLDMAFPPRLPNLVHTVINSNSIQQLALRKGVQSILIPNVMDFSIGPAAPDDYSKEFRSAIGLTDDDFIVLQPTRLVPRKGIEQTITLLGMLNEPRCKLVISHNAGDEGFEYRTAMVAMAARENVSLFIVDDQISDHRYANDSGKKVFTLSDAYQNCDLVAFPSIYEGFGNALLEAFYHKKPVVVNNYTVFAEDIGPKGFDVLLMDSYIESSLVERLREIVSGEENTEDMVETNYRIASEHFDYTHLEKQLVKALKEVEELAV